MAKWDDMAALGYAHQEMARRAAKGYHKPAPGEPVHMGVDLGHGPSKTYVTEFTRDPDGTIHVHSVSECSGEDCGNQYTGGQDF